MSSADAAAPGGEQSPGSVTIGVAISIPHPFGAELAAWRRSIGDPTADAVPPHITLLPPTELDAAGREAVEKHLESTADDHQPFRVHLRGTGTFRPVSPVVFVALARGISDCEILAAAVRTGPLPVELRFPYHPHVTVAQALPDPLMDEAYSALADYEADFLVDTFGLYAHGLDGVWRKDRTFALGSGAPGASRPGH
jgi:2'-5' RNA ligase